MQMADGHSVNGQITQNEMQTFLDHTQHAGFAEWMLKNRAHWFKTYDADHSHAIDLGELENALTDYVRVQENAIDGKKLEMIEVVLNRMKRELAILSRGGKNMTYYSLFKKYDIDGSGTMDFAELSTIVRREMRMPHKEVSDEALRLVWAAMDEDRSGLVDVQEFTTFMEGKRCLA